MLLFFVMLSQRSGRHLESFLEAVRFILTEYGPVSGHGESICPDFELQGGTLSPQTTKEINKYFFGRPPLSGGAFPKI